MEFTARLHGWILNEVNMKQRIFVMDAHPLIRSGVEALLSAKGYLVTKLRNSCQASLDKILMTKPDVLIIDLFSSSYKGYQILKVLRSTDREIKIIVYAAEDTFYLQKECALAGVEAFVSKSQPIEVLVEAVEHVSRGERFYPTFSLSRQCLNVDKLDDFFTRNLSRRETDVFKKLVSGKSVKAISEEMELSNKTVSTHKQRIMLKLNVENMVEAVELARQFEVLR